MNQTCSHRKVKRFMLASLALLLLLLLAYNGASVFRIHVPFPAKISRGTPIFWPENSSMRGFPRWASSKASLSSSFMFALHEENPPSISKTHFPLLPALPGNDSAVQTLWRPNRNSHILKILRPGSSSRRFSRRMNEFLNGHSAKSSSHSSCKIRFFMTWISSLESFGERELFTVESLFKSHPDACLIIVSESMDSVGGTQLLKPFMDLGFRVIAVCPDFAYILKNTDAETWFRQLKRGRIDPGEVSLGQNLSNVLRLALLYKYGGIYIDTDVAVLKSLSRLRNAIGAQASDQQTGNWSRLNNAVMIFDKKHPLLFKFIQEFALTFHGSKWGHNGPYLVSRVVNRVTGRTGYNFTVLPPAAFYPVDWSKIHLFFQGPRDANDSKWMVSKLNDVRARSFAVHLWNKESRMLKVEEGSIISHIMSDCCVLCSST